MPNWFLNVFFNTLIETIGHSITLLPHKEKKPLAFSHTPTRCAVRPESRVWVKMPPKGQNNPYRATIRPSYIYNIWLKRCYDFGADKKVAHDNPLDKPPNCLRALSNCDSVCREKPFSSLFRGGNSVPWRPTVFIRVNSIRAHCSADLAFFIRSEIL